MIFLHPASSVTFIPGDETNKIAPASLKAEAAQGMNVARRRRILVLSALVIAVGGASAWYALQGPEPVRAARSSAPATVPVTATTATKRDLPIYLTGLCSAQASFRVGMRPQVDGRLEAARVP